MIAFIHDGKFIVETDKNRKSFKAGELCIVEAGLVHTDCVWRDGAKYLMAWRAAETPTALTAAFSRRTSRLAICLKAFLHLQSRSNI